MNTAATEDQDLPTTGADADTEEAPEQEKLSLQVTIDEPSSCERHVTVNIDRADIDRYLEQEFDDLVPKAEVPGFRPGRAPRKLVVNRFKDQIKDQVKGKLLMDAMAQVSDEHSFSAISEPDIDLEAIELPDEGPMAFEFKLEVRPEFETPVWKGLTLDKPVRAIGDSDVDAHLAKLLARYGETVEMEGPAEDGDLLALEMSFTCGDRKLGEFTEPRVRLAPKLSFRDAQFDDFGQCLAGVKTGETRTATIKLGNEIDAEELRGQEVSGSFKVVGIERLELPKLTAAFLDEIGGFSDEDELRDAVREELERQHRYRQQQRIRQQITEQLTATASWDLPPDLLKRQARRELQRTIMELQASGFGPDAIRNIGNQLQQNIMSYTAKALKEHFILERIAEDEGIDAEAGDFDHEIELIAEQNNLPPRRVRARLEKRGEMDSLRNQIVERKVIELITDSSTVREIAAEAEQDDTTGIDHAISGAGEKHEIPEAKHGEEAGSLPGQQQARG